MTHRPPPSQSVLRVLPPGPRHLPWLRGPPLLGSPLPWGTLCYLHTSDSQLSSGARCACHVPYFLCSFRRHGLSFLCQAHKSRPPSLCPADPSLHLLPPPPPTGLSRGQSCPSHVSASPPFRSLLTGFFLSEAHPTCLLLWKHLPSPTPQGLELQDWVRPSCCIRWVPALCECEGSAPVGVQGEGELVVPELELGSAK